MKSLDLAVKTNILSKQE